MELQVIYMPQARVEDSEWDGDVLQGRAAYLPLIAFAIWSVWTMCGCPGL